jgi:bifunctional non-homologous end joining protein LigD
VKDEAVTTWVKPKLVAEVKFTEWTAAGEMRHPAYLGLREDKRPEEVVRETAKRTKP